MEAWGSTCVLYRGFDQLAGTACSRTAAFSLEAGLPSLSLVLDIGQGAGLAGATGIRPFLPPLLVGAFARADTGIDFDGSGWQFLESPGFLLAVLGLAVVSFLAERSGANEKLMARGTAAVAVVLGALLFAGTLAAGGRSAIPGLFAGAAVRRFWRTWPWAACWSAPVPGSTPGRRA